MALNSHELVFRIEWVWLSLRGRLAQAEGSFASNDMRLDCPRAGTIPKQDRMKLNPSHLLHDRLFHLRIEGGVSTYSTLPEVFELMQRDLIESFEQLRAHQEQSWYCFLVQLAAIVVQRTGLDPKTAKEGDWRGALIQLSGGDQGWNLIEENPLMPAFLQTAATDLSPFKSTPKMTLDTPDDFDIVISAKNHDIKRSCIIDPDPAHWIYALVALQTQQGFLGRGCYGVARMNGGFSSRSSVSCAPSLSWGDRWKRDLGVLLNNRESTISSFGFSSEGCALLWLEPWDGLSQIQVGSLDPYFIEVCRRMRLSVVGGRIIGQRMPTKDKRVSGIERGLSGDPWAPIQLKDGPKAFSLQTVGFGFALLNKILMGDGFHRSATQEVLEDDRFLIAQGLPRGSGKTNGLHFEVIPIPKKVRGFLRKKDKANDFAKLSQSMLEIISKIENKAFKPAICTLLQNRSKDVDYSDGRYGRWRVEFRERVGGEFFLSLWRLAEVSLEDAVRDWAKVVIGISETILEEAVGLVSRSHKAVSLAEGKFAKRAREHFPVAEKERRFELMNGSGSQGEGESFRFSKLISRLHFLIKDTLSPGERAELKRISSRAPSSPAYWRFLTKTINPANIAEGLTASEREQRWAAVLQIVSSLVGMHSRSISLGTSLSNAGFSEAKFVRLIEARGARLEGQARQAAKFLGSKGARVDLSGLSALVVYQDCEYASQCRRHIARHFFARRQ